MSGDFCRLLITFANNLKIDHEQQNISPDLDPNDSQHSVAWVMPQGWDFGSLEVLRSIFFKHGDVAYQIDGDDKQNRMQVKFSS